MLNKILLNYTYESDELCWTLNDCVVLIDINNIFKIGIKNTIYNCHHDKEEIMFTLENGYCKPFPLNISLL